MHPNQSEYSKSEHKPGSEMTNLRSRILLMNTGASTPTAGGGLAMR